jgi:hypothetical protein
MKTKKKIICKDKIKKFLLSCIDKMGSCDDYKDSSSQLYRELSYNIEFEGRKVKQWFRHCPDGVNCPKSFDEYISKVLENEVPYKEIIIVENGIMYYEITEEENGKLYSSVKMKTLN